MSIINLHTSLLQTIHPNPYKEFDISIDVLRLDQVHPVISGNKWFKLQEYIKEANQSHKKGIITFGGAYSNHIVATAAACAAVGLSSYGIIRGEEPATFSPTLQDAKDYGMNLTFISRENYTKKRIPEALESIDLYQVNEGGYGIKGMLGAQKIMKLATREYSHICAAVGTGTTLAGLINGSKDNTFEGFSVLKNNYSLENEIKALLPEDRNFRFTLNHDFHFGGYAKHTPHLINFMNEWFEMTGIPTDFVYTGKLFYGIHYLIKQHHYPPGSKILIVHSGGLQGNRSLKKGTLIFDV